MSHGWSQNDKAVAKVAAERAHRRAEDEAIALHAQYKIASIDDLWALELHIRQWRKERQYRFSLNYERANEQLAEWLSRGWLHLFRSWPPFTRASQCHLHRQELTTRSSEQRLAAASSLWLSLSSPASVAELGGVRS